MKDTDNIRRLLGAYPKSRPPLPAEHRKRYVSDYIANREGRAGLNKLKLALESWMHKRVSSRGKGGSILEIGAGTLNHVSYERHCPHYDIVEPFDEVWRTSPHRAAIRARYASIGAVPSTKKYDRIISIATLEHVENLPELLERCQSLLAPAGQFQAAIPSEGGLLWGLSWRLTTAISYRLSTGLPYGPLMRHEHLNDGDEIEALVSHFFAVRRIERFPLPSLHLSFYSYFEGSLPQNR
jgi:SAM-dependent methyltransferase